MLNLLLIVVNKPPFPNRQDHDFVTAAPETQGKLVKMKLRIG